MGKTIICPHCRSRVELTVDGKELVASLVEAPAKEVQPDGEVEVLEEETSSDDVLDFVGDVLGGEDE